jgi:hypothetical protein
MNSIRQTAIWEGSTMKRGFLKAVTISLLSIGAGAAAHGQQQSLIVNIPFAFHLGKQTLPAGTYFVAPDVLGGGSLERFRPEGGGGGITVPTKVGFIANGKTAQPRLVFRNYRGTYFLAEIWDQNGQGRELFVSSEEKELANRETPATLELASR